MTDAQQRNATQQFAIELIEFKWIGKACKDSILGWFVGFVFIIVSILLSQNTCNQEKWICHF